ncbi:hypothetical protein C0992_000087 [Termitomyces sp. T32_za158]|nr:hypothetical protein C0992_000087 [Termitomyces sp. T32_za158]
MPELLSQHAVSLDQRVVNSSASTSSGTKPAAGSTSTAGNKPKSGASMRGRRTSFFIRYSILLIIRLLNLQMALIGQRRIPWRGFRSTSWFFTCSRLRKLSSPHWTFSSRKLTLSLYSAREEEMMARTKALHEQPDQLGDHKELVKGYQRYESDYSEREKTRREKSVKSVDADVERKDGKKQHSPVRRTGLSTDPEDYLFAKKRLKKAVLEHYW